MVEGTRYRMYVVLRFAYLCGRTMGGMSGHGVHENR